MACIRHCIRTPSSISVGEIDAVDVQCNSQVDRPPRVGIYTGMHTGRLRMIHCVIAVVSLGGLVRAILVGVRTALVRRTI